MIFDKYIALIIESIERHSALTIVEIKEQNKILQTEIGELHNRINVQLEMTNKIASLEHDVQSAKAVVKSLTERNTEAQAKQERLLHLAKEYDKATVSMLNAVLERKPATEERKAWEVAKTALKGWDTPPVPKKRGRKKQS